MDEDGHFPGITFNFYTKVGVSTRLQITRDFNQASLSRHDSFSDECLRLFIVVETEPADRVLWRTLRQPIKQGQIFEFQHAAVELEVIDREDLLEVVPADLVSPLYEGVFRVGFCGWVAQPSCTYHGADLLIRKGHGDLRAPIIVVCQSVHEGRIGILRLPLFWVERLGFKTTDRWHIRITNPNPGAIPQT